MLRLALGEYSSQVNLWSTFEPLTTPTLPQEAEEEVDALKDKIEELVPDWLITSHVT